MAKNVDWWKDDGYTAGEGMSPCLKTDFGSACTDRILEAGGLSH